MIFCGTTIFSPSAEVYVTAGSIRPGVGVRSLEPYFYFIAIWIAHERIGQTGREFAARSNGAAGALDGADRRVVVFRPGKAKTEMDDSTRDARVRRTFLERKNIERPRPNT
jgi:hypothetical protein